VIVNELNFKFRSRLNVRDESLATFPRVAQIKIGGRVGISPSDAGTRITLMNTRNVGSGNQKNLAMN